MSQQQTLQQLVIAGSGCSGHTAAIYASRADLKPLVIEGNEAGGQLSYTSEVENFPGFPEGINGFDLVENMKQQAQKFGATYRYGHIEKVLKQEDHFLLKLSDDSQIQTKALIIATGASARKLNVPGEKELFGRGVSSCATCDGAFYRGKEVVVIGGGDSAMEEALFLTKFASKVTIIHRREELRASNIMIQRAKDHPKVEFLLNAEVSEILADSEGNFSHLTVISSPEGNPSQQKEQGKEVQTSRFDCDGLFLGIGHIPNSSFVRELIEVDNEGYIIPAKSEVPTDDVHTSVRGIFACGDVVDTRYRQAITAAAMGCKAALEAEHYLENLSE